MEADEVVGPLQDGDLNAFWALVFRLLKAILTWNSFRGIRACRIAVKKVITYLSFSEG